MDLINCPLSSFAVCADPNREAALQQHQQKTLDWFNVVAKDHNKFTSFTKGMDAAAIGLSRAYSDVNERALSMQGAIRAASVSNIQDYMSDAKYNAFASEQGRSTTAGKKGILKWLAAQNKYETAEDNIFGANFFKSIIGADRQYAMLSSKLMNEFGLPPIKPPPTLIPPSNKNRKILGSALMIAAAIPTGGAALAGGGTVFAGTGLAMSSATAGALGSGLSTAGNLLYNS